MTLPQGSATISAIVPAETRFVTTQKARLSGIASAVCAIVFASSVASAQSAFETHLPPVFPSNAGSCSICHSIPSTGGSSRISIKRAQSKGAVGVTEGSVVIRSAADLASIANDKIVVERLTTSIFGDGYVEAIDDKEIQEALERQKLASHGKIAGHVVRVPALEADGAPLAIGKFGWKAQHSSLLSFCSDAMLNELGIPTHLYPAILPPKSENEAALDKIVAFVRALPPPGRKEELASTASAIQGEKIFTRIGCALCHVSMIRTFPPHTIVNGGTYAVPDQLGGKTIHPYSDFLLHDVGTGDGVLQAATPKYLEPITANMFRTSPLWGLRDRTRFIHDGRATSVDDAIEQHAGEASDVIAGYRNLSSKERENLNQFLSSL